MYLHWFLGKIFSLFLSCPVFTLFSLLLLRDRWGATFAESSLTPPWLAACRAPVLCRAGSHSPASCSPPGPLTLFREPLPGVPHPVEAAPLPQTAFSSKASKKQKGLEGEILWAIQQSQQGIEGHFPKCPQLISVAVAKNLLEPRYSFEC